MKDIIYLALFALIFTAIIYWSLNAHLSYECRKWAHDAELYADYYITDWQKAQCDDMGVAIDAPVVRNY